MKKFEFIDWLRYFGRSQDASSFEKDLIEQIMSRANELEEPKSMSEHYLEDARELVQEIISEQLPHADVERRMIVIKYLLDKVESI